jgi:N-alpha-acetyltransferase 30
MAAQRRRKKREREKEEKRKKAEQQQQQQQVKNNKQISLDKSTTEQTDPNTSINTANTHNSSSTCNKAIAPTADTDIQNSTALTHTTRFTNNNNPDTEQKTGSMNKGTDADLLESRSSSTFSNNSNLPQTNLPETRNANVNKIKKHKYADVAYFVDGAKFDTTGVVLSDPEITYTCYQGEHQLAFMAALIEKDLSEPYSIYTYRYFTNNWPDLTFLAMSGNACVGTIVCKLAPDENTGKMKGYIAMLAVDKAFRKRAIGSSLVRLVVEGMRYKKADLIVLETEITNKGAISLYQRLHFTRECRLEKYYLNGVDAFRLKLWLTPPALIPHYKM